MQAFKRSIKHKEWNIKYWVLKTALKKTIKVDHKRAICVLYQIILFHSLKIKLYLLSFDNYSSKLRVLSSKIL